MDKALIQRVENILSTKACFEDRLITDYRQLRRVLKVLRLLNKTISMTQGVYDILHDGHIRYLNKAKEFGDVLVVAVDSDEYTRIRKSRPNEHRPAITLKIRLEVLSSLRSVGILTVRDVDKHLDDPYTVIKVVRPDVLVMSKSTKDVGEKDYEALSANLLSFNSVVTAKI